MRRLKINHTHFPLEIRALARIRVPAGMTRPTELITEFLDLQLSADGQRLTRICVLFTHSRFIRQTGQPIAHQTDAGQRLLPDSHYKWYLGQRDLPFRSHCCPSPAQVCMRIELHYSRSFPTVSTEILKRSLRAWGLDWRALVWRRRVGLGLGE